MPQPRSLADDMTGGLLCYVVGVKYHVLGMSMDITQGGTGQAVFNSLLDRGPFPPTIKGVIAED